MTAQPSRRIFLGHAAALAAGLGAAPSAWAANPTPQVLTSWMRGERSWAGLWTPGQAPRGVALPARAHQILALPGAAGQPRMQALVMARRPGEYLLRMDPWSGKALQWHTMEDDRYLGGHAVLAADARSFFTTETDGASGQGLVAERDLRTLEKLREFPSGGIGPHAVLLEPGGNLLVANGGILNLPETGRRKLNIGRMDSNLTRLDARSGEVIAQYRLDDSFLSLRHLAMAPDGTVGVALQAEHLDVAQRRHAPGLALLRGNHLRTVAWEPSDLPSEWDGYAGDVCISADRFTISAPHAGWLASWSTQGEAPQTHALRGAGALAAMGTQWLAMGDVATELYADRTASPQRFNISAQWDNHAVMLPSA